MAPVVSSPLSGVFISQESTLPRKGARSPTGQQLKASCHQGRAREEITRVPFTSASGCSSPCSPRRGTVPRPPCLQSPKSSRSATYIGRNGGSGCSYPMSPNSSNRRKTFGAKAVAKKDFEATLDGIESALRAVHQAVKDVDERQQVQKRACELALISKDKDFEASNWPRPSLRDARRSLKEHVQAEERSVQFTRGLLAKLDSIRDSVEI